MLLVCRFLAGDEPSDAFDPLPDFLAPHLCSTSSEHRLSVVCRDYHAAHRASVAVVRCERSADCERLTSQLVAKSVADVAERLALIHCPSDLSVETALGDFVAEHFARQCAEVLPKGLDLRPIGPHLIAGAPEDVHAGSRQFLDDDG